MSFLGSLAFWMFVAFPLYPLLYLGRLLCRSRRRAPLALIAIAAQNLSFVALAAWFVWVARVSLQPVVFTVGIGDLSLPTRLMLALSDLVRTPAGALAGVALAVAALRQPGRCFARAWRDPAVPVWRIDGLALASWTAMATVLGFEVLALLVPLMTVSLDG